MSMRPHKILKILEDNVDVSQGGCQFNFRSAKSAKNFPFIILSVLLSCT